MELQLGGTLPSSHETVGPLLIGFALSCAVFGIFTGQVGTYYQRYFQDRLLYKMLVSLSLSEHHRTILRGQPRLQSFGL